MIPLRDNVPARRFPVVTLTLIVTNVLVFLFQNSLPDHAHEVFIRLRGVVPLRFGNPPLADSLGYPSGAWTSMLSYMFLHGGWFHLISNMWALWLFGDNVEDRLGRVRYLFFYAVCGVLAALAHVMLNASSAMPTVGASGAIAGVMGAYFLMFPYARMVVMIPIIIYPLLIEIPASIYLFIWIATQIVSGTFDMFSAGVAGVAFWAHIGGFFAGMLLSDKHRS